MKGNKEIVERLNVLLTDELSAINQYMVHSEMCENWGYNKLHDAIRKRAFQEMKHAEKLIERILFLEGMPVVNNLNNLLIGNNVEKQFTNDLESEISAIKLYNESIKICMDLGDNGTREVLDEILKDEEKHADWLEVQLDQISQIDMKNYLTQQIS